ncbi:uncharacterized protein YALI1_D14910g [Yarrowia lipolytica]|uniref:Uncharacterized protein n=1 Tax=Yarrowia lipolytica TaxID=4952 RepID=A0A1D8NE83_YARLL|nr:hypothetical protein YALI1_D14910g [Yarrowia lipolytica]
MGHWTFVYRITHIHPPYMLSMRLVSLMSLASQDHVISRTACTSSLIFSSSIRLLESCRLRLDIHEHGEKNVSKWRFSLRPQGSSLKASNHSHHSCPLSAALAASYTPQAHLAFTYPTVQCEAQGLKFFREASLDFLTTFVV